MISTSCFFDVFLSKKEQNVIFQTDFQGKPLIGTHEKSCKKREPMARLWRTLNSKRYCVRSPLEFRTIFARVFQRYQPVSLKSLQNPIYFFGILHIFWNPKQNRNRIPASNFGIPFFFSWNPMDSDAFFPWNPMESYAFFWNPRAYIRLWLYILCV